MAARVTDDGQHAAQPLAVLGGVLRQRLPLRRRVVRVVPVGIDDVEDNLVTVLVEEEEVGVHELGLVPELIRDRQRVAPRGRVAIPAEQGLGLLDLDLEHLPLPARPAGVHREASGVRATFGDRVEVERKVPIGRLSPLVTLSVGAG